MSNTFPKVSPDGKWIVFVKCRNGQLMRPDSELWIVPAAGGEARKMRCNTSRMNSWHSFSPNGRWMVFSSKANTPYTQMFLTHIDEQGNDSPPILIPNSTAANRAVNIPEFVNTPYDEFVSINVPAIQYLRDGMRGIELFEQGKLDEALVQFETAVRAQPDYLEGHVSAAVILIEKGRIAEATVRLKKALDLDPKCWFAHANLGLIRQSQGKPDEAIEHFRKAIELNPKHLIARANLGRALAEQGMLEEAAVHFRAAVDLAPADAGSRVNLGNALLEQGKLAEAVDQYEKGVEIDPGLLHARLGLAEALSRQRDFEAAIAQYRSAHGIDPNDLGVMNGLAWLLATCPNDELRNPMEAVELAERTCKATGNQDPVLMRTLAAAYAEAGKWSDAVATAASAWKLAEPHDPLLAQEIGRQLEGYRQGKPVRHAP
jgi:tetratricopeptide (TPR) repeat protein